jgi:SET family sugar efflux transporter-like MFS transporter
LVTTLVGLTGAFVSPFLPVFLSQTLHASPLQSALFLFLTPVAAVAVSTVVGRVSDRPGAREWVIFTAATCGILGFALYAVMRQYDVVLAVSLTLVAVASAIVPQIYALGREVVQRQDPSRVTMGMNTLRMMMSLAWAAGAPLGAFVIGLIDFNGLFIATSMLHLAALAVVIALRGRSAQVVAPTASIVVTDSAPAPAGWLTRGRVVAITVAFVALQGATSLTVTTMPLFVSVTLHGTLTSAGVVLGLCATIEIPLMLIVGAMAERWPLRRLMLAGGGFGMAYCLAVSLAGSVWQIAVAQVLHACYVCAIGGLGISYFQGLMPFALGRATTLFSNAGRLSGMLAGLAFGVVQVLGYRYAYVFSLGFCGAGTAVLALASRQRQTAPAARALVEAAAA